MSQNNNSFFLDGAELLTPTTKQPNRTSAKFFQRRANASASYFVSRGSNAQLLPAKKISMQSPKNWQTLQESRYYKKRRTSHDHTSSEPKVPLMKKISSMHRPTKQSFHRSLQSPEVESSHTFEGALLQKMGQIEEQYLGLYAQQDYDAAASMLIKILNYAIDYKQMRLFQQTLKQIAEFHYSINKTNISLYYFNQCRLCAMLVNNPDLLIDSLVGCCLCCKKYELFTEAIVFLKKALECSWFYNKAEQELKIYDEIGKVYYHLGQLQRASKFHQMFLNSAVEPENSANRNLSRQRMLKMYAETETKIYSEINVLFLANFSLPIYNSRDLPCLEQIKQTARDQIEVNFKYLNHFCDIRMETAKVLRQDFFQVEMEEPETGATPSTPTTPRYKKKKKFELLDLRMKQHLKEMGIGANTKIELKPKNLLYKQSLDEQVRKKVSEPSLDADWEEKMVKQIKRDRQNKLFKVQSQIRVRGKNKPIRPEVEHMRKIFMSIYR